MKITRRYLPRNAELLGLIFALLLVVFISVLSFRAWSALNYTNEQLGGAQGIAAAANAVLSPLQDAEAGQRGFLLTGEDSYLGPYRRAVAQIPAAMESLESAAAGHPNQTARIEALKPLVEAKLDELQQTIDLRRSAGSDAALAIVRSNRGENSMNRIRAACAEIQRVAYRQVRERSAAAHESANRLAYVGTLGSIGLFVLLGLSAITIQKGTLRRQRLIRDLQVSEGRTAEARDLLETTIGSIGDGVIATDPAGRVTLMNAVAQSLTGWTQGQAEGLPFEKIFVIQDEETGAPVESPAGQALREGKIAGISRRANLVSRDRREVPIDDTAAPIRDAAGNLIGVVVVFRDVTEKREAERKVVAELASHAELLERTNADLQHSAYATSHDLREPLRTITACAEVVQLRSGSRLDEKSQECLQFVVAAAQRMRLLIDALLDYSKAGEITNRSLRVVQVEDALKRALGNLNGSIEANQAEISHDPLPAIVGDDGHVEQLMQNLIGNALKYRRQEPPHVHVAAKQRGKEWLFSVSDNGQGIAPQYHSQVFELFKRLHGPHYPGTGIGLATCKKIVERYGGRIWVESEVDKGSTFFFTLPVS